MKLYTSWFSPFARKVALALEHKGLTYEAVDGLARSNHEELRRRNPRAEVPVLVDGEIVVSNSADILAYLDHAYPHRPLYPSDPGDRVRARAFERLSDSRLDAILVCCSLWTWAKREDQTPEGLHQAGQQHVDGVLTAIEETLRRSESSYLFGPEPGVGEFSLWPHLSALRPLGFSVDRQLLPRTTSWLKRLRQQELFKADARRTADFLRSMTAERYELHKIFWRGDRIEWLLANGFHEWFYNEIVAERVLWPPQL